MKGKTNLALCLLLLSFCGLLGTKGVPKEQVNADLGDRTISIKGANDAEEQCVSKTIRIDALLRVIRQAKSLNPMM